MLLHLSNLFSLPRVNKTKLLPPHLIHNQRNNFSTKSAHLPLPLPNINLNLGQGMGYWGVVQIQALIHIIQTLIHNIHITDKKTVGID